MLERRGRGRMLWSLGLLALSLLVSFTAVVFLPVIGNWAFVPLILTVIVGARVGDGAIVARGYESRYCPSCGYDLVGLVHDTCSECGAAIPESIAAEVRTMER